MIFRFREACSAMWWMAKVWAVVITVFLALNLVCAVRASAQRSVSTFPVDTNITAVTVGNHIYFGLLDLREITKGTPIDVEWGHAEQCSGLSGDVNSVSWYGALQIVLARPQREPKFVSIWGVFYEDPPEIIFAVTDATDEQVRSTLFHEALHALTGWGEEDPRFVACLEWHNDYKP